MTPFEPCKASTPGAVREDKEVKDFTLSHPYKAERIYTPASRRELVAAVLDGEAAGGGMKADGGRYSLSAAQNADSRLIETTKLDRYLGQPFPRRNSQGELIELPADRIREGHESTFLGFLVRPEVPRPDRTHLVHVEAGIGIKQLLADLAKAKLGLPTMGSGGSQTLAGAVSTGTHGSDFRIPPLGDCIKAMHLVGPGGREWWIEPSHGVAGGKALADLPGWCPGTYVVRDDEFFRAALVGVGRLGVIYSVVLEVREDYRIEDRSVRAADWAEPGGQGVRAQLRKAAQSPGGDTVFSDDRGGFPLRYFSAVVDLASGKHCWITRRWETTNDEDVLPKTSDTFPCEDPSHLAGVVFALKGFFTGLEAKALAVPFVGLVWAPRIVAFWVELMDLAHKSETNADFLTSAAAKAAALPESEVGPDAAAEIRGIVRGFSTTVLDGVHKPLRRGPSAKVLDQHNYDIDHCYSGDSAELFFDAGKEDYLAFVDDVIEAARGMGPIPGWISLRYVRKSQALLAMEQFERTVAIEVAVPRKSDGTDLYKPFMDKVVSLNRKHGGLPHWGQKHSLAPEELESLYPAGVEPFRWALAELEGEPARKTFSSKFTRARGLEVEEGKRLADYRAQRSGGVIVSSTIPVLFGC